MSNIQRLRGISVGHIAAKSYAAAAAGSSLLCTERNAPQWDQHITSPRGQYEPSAYIGMTRFCFMMEKLINKLYNNAHLHCYLFPFVCVIISYHAVGCL